MLNVNSFITDFTDDTNLCNFIRSGEENVYKKICIHLLDFIIHRYPWKQINAFFFKMEL